VDGPPGIGCPVIAAAAGPDLAVIVTEPTLAGVHDLKRILETTTHFNIPAQVVINKADIYPEGSAQIASICKELNMDLVGEIPFDPTVGMAMMNGEPVTSDHGDAPASKAIAVIWKLVLARIKTLRGIDD
jgi:MinD superfamily P-loop ATPase